MVDYQRQRTLPLVIPPTVIIIGCGGVGFWVALDCALVGVATLYLYDPDKVEATNLNRLPFCEGAVGRYKVEAAADYIHAARPDCTIWPLATKFDATNMLNGETVIECSDSPRNQLEVYNLCQRQRVRFIRAGYNETPTGAHVTVTGNVPAWMPNDEQASYEIVPSCVMPAQLVAALVVEKLTRLQMSEVSTYVKDVGVTVLRKLVRRTNRCYQPRRRRNAQSQDNQQQVGS